MAMGKYCPIHQICRPPFKCQWAQIFYHFLLLPATFLLVASYYCQQHSSQLLPFTCLNSLLSLSFTPLSVNNGDPCSISHLSQLKCKGTLNIFMYFFQQIANGSNTILATCVQKKNSSRTLLLLLLLASSIPIDLNCFKFHCVPSLPPTILLLGFGSNCYLW